MGGCVGGWMGDALGAFSLCRHACLRWSGVIVTPGGDGNPPYGAPPSQSRPPPLLPSSPANNSLSLPLPLLPAQCPNPSACSRPAALMDQLQSCQQAW